MESIRLTVEQQFQLKALESQIQNLSREQAQESLLEAVQQGMLKDNIINRYTKVAVASIVSSVMVATIACWVVLEIIPSRG